MAVFTVTAEHLRWIDGSQDDPDDLCLHGDCAVQFGEYSAEYENATVSATALMLLRALEEDHTLDDSVQLIPCCGFNMYAEEDGARCLILGCPNGVDWTIQHDGNDVVMNAPGHEDDPVRIPFSQFRDEVFRFADQIEAFYRSCTPKTEPDDEIDRAGWAAFRREWHRRRNKSYDRT